MRLVSLCYYGSLAQSPVSESQDMLRRKENNFHEIVSCCCDVFTVTKTLLDNSSFRLQRVVIEALSFNIVRLGQSTRKYIVRNNPFLAPSE